jgi:hypothetical protein
VIWRAKWRENRQKLQMRRDNDRFPPKSSCGLSYQACRIPRILRPVGHAGFAGTGRPFLFFDPAETT